MKYAFIVSALMMFGFSSALPEDISWIKPTTYEDNTSISVVSQSTITTKLYKGLDHVTWGSSFATITSGGTTWSGSLGVAKGTLIYITATATIPAEGLESAYAQYVSWTVPYVAPMAPNSIFITRGN